ncbi:MAG TPA: stealth conserved region 3 domain-containing protein [Anaerolineae bacterium]|nr:stealth conserved region 3 domain-containing protein [Anaerolineae bacterium]HOQ97723.1 stealth conserved region 3 domain-containing protein [Anaerolineae bacterium]HPL29848.1 stealth conserved region 3 domain-containing protein [Anaerolineae bacterium]
MRSNEPTGPDLEQLEQELTHIRCFDYVRLGHDRRRIELLPRNRIGGGRARLEQTWHLLQQDGRTVLALVGEEGITCTLQPHEDGVWRGRWLAHERMPVELRPAQPAGPVAAVASAAGNEPIDAVYSWVDGSDPAFRQTLRYWAACEPGAHLPDQLAGYRYRDNDELRFSLRSLAVCAPWVRHIFLVTNGQTPRWLAPAHPRLTVVPHEAIFPDRQHLPTFNSHAIELHLQRIPGLSRRFLYLNDDVLLGRPVAIDDLVVPGGAQTVYLEPRPLPAHPHTGAVHDRAYAYTQGLLDEHLAPRPARQAIAHTPQMYDRELMAEVQRIWAGPLAETSAHRFRSPRDVALRILYYHYALQAEQHRPRHTAATVYSCSADYCFLRLTSHVAETVEMLDDLLFQKPRFICINDELDDSAEADIVRACLRARLQEYYPQPCEFERGPA